MITTAIFDNKPFNKIIANLRKTIGREISGIFFGVREPLITTPREKVHPLQQEIDRLQYENSTLIIALEEKQKLLTLVHQTAHDISSPLSALAMMVTLCDELQDNKRAIINKATARILDIADNLLCTYRNDGQQTTSHVEERQPVLISEVIIQLMSEKKVQYLNHKIRFETDIASNAQLALAKVQPNQFRRCMSNLINNAVDALDSRNNDLITVNVAANAQAITVTIQDNGKGMSLDMISKIQNHQSFTEGKENGHGLGLQQVWGTLEANQGIMKVQATLGKGTSIQLIFPRVMTLG